MVGLLRYPAKNTGKPHSKDSIMRSALDRLVSWFGFALAAVLLVAAGLLAYGSSFINSNVEEQLSQQNITMPAVDRLETPAQKEALSKYAGQKMTTGAQAKAFADQYILVHMNTSSNNKTYEEVSGEYMKAVKTAPDAKETRDLGDLRQSLFMGNTLRGMLLNAYAFGTMATVAMWAAIGALLGAIVFFVLGLLGLRHAKRVDPAASA